MFILVSVVFGLVFGSFINAVVWRLYQQSLEPKVKSLKLKAKSLKLKAQNPQSSVEFSITKGRSICPECKHRLAAIDLVPVVSWLALRGRCRYCHKAISAQYPLVELLVGALFGLSAAALIGPTPAILQIVNFGFWIYFLVVLVILALYDMHWYLLPDVVLLPAIVVGLARLLVLLIIGQSLLAVSSYILAALAVGVAFYSMAAVSKGRWMGGGDIKLVFLMGLILGWSKLAVALLLAFNGGALVGVMLIGLKIKHRKDHIPFGPFLVGGTIVAMLYGQSIIEWYLRGMGYY